MADGLSVAVADAAAGTIVGTSANDVQLHNGPPGAAGTANVASVTTRQGATWGSPSGGGVATSNQQVWANWAGTNGEDITDISLWSAPTSGTFGFSAALNSPVTMDTGDSLTITSISVTLPTAS